MITSNLPRTAKVAGLMTRLAGDGGPGVRFAVVSHPLGTGIVDAATGVASAMRLDVTRIDMSSLFETDMSEGAPKRVAHEKRLGQVGDACFVLEGCDLSYEQPLRETIEMLRLQDTDRDDEPRAVLVLLTTHGPIDRMKEAVLRATGRSTVAFDIVE